MVTIAMKLKSLASWKESYNKPRQHVRNQRHHIANKHLCSQSCGFSSSHVQMWQLDHNKDWTQKNCCFQTVVLEKTLESAVAFEEINPVNPKGNQPWILTLRTDAKAEVPIHWPPDAKSWLSRKDPNVQKDCSQKEKGSRGWDD